MDEIKLKEGIVIFFKVWDSTKKSIFSGSSLEELYNLFFTKFPEMNEKFNEKRPPEFQISKTGDAKNAKELTDIKQLSSHCILELKLPTPEMHNKRDYSFGYYEFQRQKLVGLPARGKSYIARKVARYLKWVGVPTQVFNVGNYRRERLGANQTHDFFDPNNEQGSRQRLHMAIAALDDMLNWLNKGGKVAIYDATNTTKERRSMIQKRCQTLNIQVVFIESICRDASIVDRSVRETKVSSPDYIGQDAEKAINDFKQRIMQYEKTYQPLDESDSNTSYVKVIDVGRQHIVNKIDSYLSSRVIYFLMNLHVTPRPIWLTRHGESEYNLDDRIGGDSPLTPKGDEFAHTLADWVENHIKTHNDETLSVWTSTLKRSIATAQYINYPKINLKSLDEIDAGLCDSMTYSEIAEKMPEEFAARSADKLSYRYPHGESYIDLIQRLEPVLFELERQRSPVLIVGHQAVLRCLYAYFLGIDAEEIPYIPIQMNVVYELMPKAYSCEVKQFNIL